MATINSVLGPLDTADLGFTLTHEHVFTASAGVWQTYPELFGDVEKLADEAALMLTEARDGGVKTIVDLSTFDLGRDVRFLADVAQRTGVNIICATGIWRDIPRVLWNRSPDEVAALFVNHSRSSRQSVQPPSFTDGPSRGRRHFNRHDPQTRAKYRLPMR